MEADLPQNSSSVIKLFVASGGGASTPVEQWCRMLLDESTWILRIFSGARPGLRPSILPQARHRLFPLPEPSFRASMHDWSDSSQLTARNARNCSD
jgi:hypothetical protein